MCFYTTQTTFQIRPYFISSHTYLILACFNSSSSTLFSLIIISMEADDMSLRVASFSCYLNNPEESLVQKIAGGASEDLPRPDGPFPARARTSSANVVHGVKSSSKVKIPKAVAMDKDDKVSTASSDHGSGESFSSCLRPPENNNNNSGFAFKTASAGPVEDPTVSFVFPSHMNPSGNAAAKRLEKRVVGKSRNDGEISIFDADKYFNMKLDLAYTPPTRSGKINKNKNEIPVQSPCTEPKSTTVSVSSEPSSFGSKAVLLHNPKPRKAAVIRRSFFDRLGCHGRCLDKKAVVVIDERDDHHHHGSKQVADDSQKHSGDTSSKREEQEQEEEEQEQRKSLEVFGSHKTGKGDVAVNLERKLSVLTWDAIPNTAQPTHAPTTATTICDDMASDASSDLFEIENFSDSTRHRLMLASQTAGGFTSGCASPVTQYAPSEASITWSVVTAGVADHSSVISDYDESSVSIVGGTIHRATAGKTGKFKDVTGKSSPKPRFTGILGCNSDGAVNISDAAHNTGDRRKLGKSIHHSPDDISDHLHA